MMYADDEHSKMEVRAEQATAGERFKPRIAGLCRNCTHAMIYRTPRMNTPIVLCGMTSPERAMPTDIVDCTKFSQVGVLSVWELAKLAIDIDITPNKTAGFKG
jgi:hypothetical protein